jgi:S-adenosyl methyltransferase
MVDGTGHVATSSTLNTPGRRLPGPHTLQLVTEDAEARQIVTRLMGATTPGSFLVITHPASDIDAEHTAEATRRLNDSRMKPTRLRDRAGVAGLFVLESEVASTAAPGDLGIRCGRGGPSRNRALAAPGPGPTASYPGGLSMK